MTLTINQLLKKYLLASGKTDAEVADASNVKRPTLSRLLNEPSRRPHFQTVRRLAVTLNIPGEELLSVQD